MLYEHELLRERMAVEETAVRKRLEQELSALRNETHETSAVDVQRIQEKAERFQSKARKYQDELNAHREKFAEQTAARQREKNTWQLRIRAAEKNHETRMEVLETDAHTQLDELESDKEELQARIDQLTSTVQTLRKRAAQEGRMSAQMDRA